MMTFLLAVALLGAMSVSCPWVTDEERDSVRGRVTGYDFQPGTPETDAKRFYSNAEKTEFVEFNYDEAKAGELGRDYTLEG